jgi:hypothetical protein
LAGIIATRCANVRTSYQIQTDAAHQRIAARNQNHFIDLAMVGFEQMQRKREIGRRPKQPCKLTLAISCHIRTQQFFDGGQIGNNTVT